jgi:hypothetical protein
VSAAPRIAVQGLLVIASAAPFALVVPGVVRAHRAHVDRPAALASAPSPSTAVPSAVPLALRPPSADAFPGVRRAAAGAAPSPAACPARRPLPVLPEPLRTPCTTR